MHGGCGQPKDSRPGEQHPSCLPSTLRNFSVEMYFRNESDKAPWPLSLPGCPHRCPLQDFLRLTEPVVPKDWQQECQLASGPADTGELLPASVLVTSQNNLKFIPMSLEGAATLPAILLHFPRQLASPPRDRVSPSPRSCAADALTSCITGKIETVKREWPHFPTTTSSAYLLGQATA